MAERSWKRTAGAWARADGRPNFTRTLPNLMVGEYPTPADADWLRAQGVTAVLSLQDDADLIDKGLDLESLEDAYVRAELQFAREDWLGAAADVAPCVLLGDLNLGPRSAAYRLLRSRLQDALAGPLAGFRRTFPSGLPLVRIDHVLFAGPLRARRAGVGRRRPARVASDHLPAWADLVVVEP